GSRSTAGVRALLLEHLARIAHTESRPGGASHNAIGLEAVLSLERAHGTCGLAPEDAVGRQAERALKRLDAGSVDARGGGVMMMRRLRGLRRLRRVRGLRRRPRMRERVLRRRADAPVGRQTLALLERLD